MPKDPLKLAHALRLKCPYCGESPLREDGSWVEFAEGCHRCGYRYHREDGYFSGAPWMITYPVVAVICLVFIVGILSMDSPPPTYLVVGISGLIGVGFAILTMPWAKALWLYLDHRFHPLEENDRWPVK